MKRSLFVVLALACLIAAPAEARRKATLVDQAVDAYENQHSFELPAAGSLEVAFSPNEGTEHLVVKVIDAAKFEIRVLSYSFTSAPVTEALLRAKRRGVDIKVVADQRENINADRSGKAHAALSALATAGVDVRTISVYPIHHDKVIVVDRQSVELGSFNYSDAASHKNSENVLVNWGNPKLAQIYLQHFERNYRQSTRFQAAY